MHGMVATAVVCVTVLVSHFLVREIAILSLELKQFKFVAVLRKSAI